MTVLLGNGDGTFGEQSDHPYDGGLKPKAITSADFEGDGDADIATANLGYQGTQYATVFLNTRR